MTASNPRIPCSILELASVKHDTNHRAIFEECLDLAQQAEQWGYRRLWFAEHHNMINIASSAPPVLIGYVAGGTEKIQVGSGGVMLPNHSPLIVAEQFGTLGTLYPGRIDLGLGRAPGTDQTTANAIRPDREQATLKFPEHIDEMQQYFSSDNRQARVRAPIAEGVEMPFYILGSSPDSAKLAARKGLPYAFASHFAPTHLYEALSLYYNNFQPSEQLKKPYAIGTINVIAADTDEEAERLSTSMIRMILGVLTNQMDYMREPTEMTSEMQELKQHPALQQFLNYAFIGSKETVKQQTQNFLEETGVSEVMVASHIYNHQERLKSYRLFSEIMQEL